MFCKIHQVFTVITYITISILSAGLSQAGGGLQPLQFLTDQLTHLNQGEHIIPTQHYKPPGFSDLATALKWITYVFKSKI